MNLASRWPTPLFLLIFAACDTNNVVGVVVDSGTANIDSGIGDIDGALPADADVSMQGSLGPIGEFCGTIGGGEVRHIVAASKAPIMAVAYASGFVAIHDATTGALKQSLAGHSGPVQAMSITSDGRRLATAWRDKATVWDATTGALLYQVASSLRITDLAFSPDDATFVTTDWAGIVTQWATLDGRSNWRAVFDDSVVSAHLLPDGSGVAVGKGLSLIILSASNGAIMREVRIGAGITEFEGGIVGISPDGKYAVGSFFDRVFAWSLETGARIWEGSSQHRGRANAIDPQGEFVVVKRLSPAPTAGQPAPTSTTVALLRAADGELLSSMPVAGETTAIAVLPGQGKIAFGTPKGEIVIHDIVSGAPSSTITEPADPVYALATSTGSARGIYTTVERLNIWSPEEGAVKQIKFASPRPVWESFALSPNGSMVAILVGTELRIFSVPEGQLLGIFHRDVTSASFSPDGQKVLTTCHCAGKGESIQEWSPTRTLLASFGPPNLNVSNAVYAPDGKRVALIASAGLTSEGIVAMLDLQSNQMLWQAGPAHEGALQGLRGNLAFSPDGTMLAFKDLRAVGTGAVTIFNSSSGAVVKQLSLPGGDNPQTALNARTDMPSYYSGDALEFSPDQAYLALAGSKGVHVWRTSDWRAHDPIAVPANSLVFDRKRGTLMLSDVDGSLRKWCGVGAALPQ